MSHSHPRKLTISTFSEEDETCAARARRCHVVRRARVSLSGLDLSTPPLVFLLFFVRSAPEVRPSRCCHNHIKKNYRKCVIKWAGSQTNTAELLVMRPVDKGRGKNGRFLKQQFASCLAWQKQNAFLLKGFWIIICGERRAMETFAVPFQCCLWFHVAVMFFFSSVRCYKTSGQAIASIRSFFFFLARREKTINKIFFFPFIFLE